MAKPITRSERLTVRLTRDDRRFIRRLAAERRMTMADVVAELVERARVGAAATAVATPREILADIITGRAA